MSLVFGVIGVIAFLVVLLWLIGLPGDEEEEELAGLVAGNWDRIEDRVDSG